MNEIKKISNTVGNWAKQNFLKLMLFNAALVLLFLLRSAGYFDPYFLISVNSIILVGLILAVILLRAGSRTMFFIGLTFWLFAGLLRLFELNVWAERTGVYVFESLILGVILLIIENYFRNR